MIKTFIKYMFFEKAIDVIFSSLENSFKKPVIKMLGISTEIKNGKLITTLSKEINGELYTVKLVHDESEIEELKRMNLSDEQILSVLHGLGEAQMEFEIKLKENPDYFRNTHLLNDIIHN